MSVLNIIMLCFGGFLLGIVSVWLASNVSSRLRNRAERKREEPKTAPKKGIGTMNMILIIVGISLVWFTHRMIVLYETTNGIPDTLVSCVFAVLGGECGVMGWIKTTKEKRQDRKWEEEDRIRMENEAKQTAQDFEPEYSRSHERTDETK